MSEGPVHVPISASTAIERDMAAQSRALLRAQHARLFPTGCPQWCADCRARLRRPVYLPAVEVESTGGLEWVGMALVAMAAAMVIGLAWLALSAFDVAGS